MRVSDGTPKWYDVAVLGGGPAGCAAAIRFAQGGARVLLLERLPRSAFKPGEIIEASVRQAFAALNLQDRFPVEDTLTLAGRLTAWDDMIPSETAGVYNPRGHGLLVDRAGIEDWLIREAATSGVTVTRGFTALRATRTQTAWSLNWAANDGPAGATAPLLLEATGRGSGVLGAGRRRRLDRMVALMAYVPAPPSTHDQRLIIEATEDGWWYGALLPGRRVVLAFLTDARDLPAGPAARRMQWRARLAATNHLRDLVAGVDLDQQPIRGFPAESSIRETLSGPGWVAVGEAAAAYDPLSGQGVAAALTKGTALARLVIHGENLSGAIARYTDAERETFRHYTRDRRRVYARAAGRFTSPFWDVYKSPDA